MPHECIAYSDFTMLPWSALIDMHVVARIVPVVERWDSSSAWLKNYLNVSQSEIALLKDSLPYQFQIYDDPMNQRYPKELGSARLIHFGSLFGTSRLRLKRKVNRHIRRQVKERMIYSNQLLLDISRSISDSLGGPYYHGIHLRLGDGEFETSSKSNVHLVCWSLVTRLMGLPFDETREVEANAMRWNVSSEWPAPPPVIEPSENPNTVVSPNMSPLSPIDMTNLGFLSSDRSALCRQYQYPTSSNLTRLDFPVYIAADAPSSRTNPSLDLFLRTIPCIFFLSDFTPQLHMLEAVKNEDDGLPLKPFLLPFIDSMVAAMVNRVIGTPHSTFSRFTVDVMNRRYHGLPIIERERIVSSEAMDTQA
ncbi:hypothetical protein DL93DRAFT_2127556 [Clavulina sp. PMI_390]|nr:hypothetical protein DL93DRAFT_2127556 [Clavulina sp. PMI_390]